MAFDWNREVINRYDPPSEELLADFERELGCPLPHDYRDFLKQYNGGDFKDGAEVIPDLFADKGFDRPCLDSMKALSPDVDDEHDLRRSLLDEPAPAHFCIAHGTWVGLFLATSKEEFGKLYLRHDGVLRQLCDSITELAKLLKKYELDEEDYEETLPIFRAIENGDDETLEQYLRDGGSPNAVNEHGTPLLVAACKQPHIVRALINYGADVHKAAADGCTATLNAAVQSFDSLRQVLSAGGDPNMADEAGLYPLKVCNDWRSFRLLIEHGADVAVVSKTGETVFDGAGSSSSRCCRLLAASGYDMDAEVEKLRREVERLMANPNTYELKQVCRKFVSLGSLAIDAVSDLERWKEGQSFLHRSEIEKALRAIRGDIDE